jgi:hypothetical protein
MELIAKLQAIFLLPPLSTSPSPTNGGGSLEGVSISWIRHQLEELFEGCKSPMSFMECRVPASLWAGSVDRVAAAVESDLPLQRSFAALQLEDLQFRDGGGGSSSSGGFLTFDAFGVVKTAVHAASLPPLPRAMHTRRQRKATLP